MRHSSPAALPVVEWSPRSVSAYDPVTRETVAKKSLSEVAPLVEGRRVVVALSRKSAFLRAVRVPNASHEDVERSIAMQVGNLFPIQASELGFGFRLTDDVGADGRLALVAACPAETLRRLETELSAAGLVAEAIVPASVGAPQLVSDAGLSDAVVVERGTEGLSFDVVSDGELRATRVAPDTLNGTEIEQEVCRSFAVAGLPCGAAIAAGGMDLPSAAYRTQTRTLDALSNGAALRLGIRLELPEAGEKRRLARMRSRARMALLAAAAAAVMTFFSITGQMDKLAAAKASDARWQDSIRTVKSARDAVASRASRFVRTAGLLANALDPGQRPSEILTTVGNALPKDVWITGASFERGKPIQVRGTALKNEGVSEFIDKLSANERFRDVKLVFANNALIDTTPVVNFSISLHAIGNLPIVEVGKGARPR